MTRTEVAGIVTVVAVSSAGGWFAGTQWTEAQRAEASSSALQFGAAPPTPAPQALAGDSVTLFSDGTVAIHLQRAPLPWLLAEIVRQGGEVPGGEATSSRRVAATAASCPQQEPAEPAGADPARLIQALREGNEAQRRQALAEASSDDVALPQDLLRQLIDTDPSDRIRLAAFKAYADANSNEAEAARAALEAGRYNHSPAVQAEARRRIEEFERGRAMQPVNDPQTGR